MTEPGRAPSAPRARAVRFLERLLCWSLAAGMTSAAADLVLDPRTPWWSPLWVLPWYLAGGCFLAWAVLRAREKAARRPPHGEAGTDARDAWERAA